MSRLMGASSFKQLSRHSPLTGAASANVSVPYGHNHSHSSPLGLSSPSLLGSASPAGTLREMFPCLCGSPSRLTRAIQPMGTNPCLLNSTSHASQGYPCQPGYRIPSAVYSTTKQHFIGLWEPFSLLGLNPATIAPVIDAPRAPRLQDALSVISSSVPGHWATSRIVYST